MGYRHMCRFFSGPLFAHPALSQYELVWRLDSDSFLLGPPTADPFVQVEAANASYAWVHAYRDEPVFVTGLWTTTKALKGSKSSSFSVKVEKYSRSGSDFSQHHLKKTTRAAETTMTKPIVVRHQPDMNCIRDPC